MTSPKRRIAIIAVYAVLLAGIAWQAKVVAGLFTPGGKYVHARSYKVNVLGDVRRPGTYRVQEGTTQFEILKVAGVRPTSDLSAFNLTAQVDENSDLNVGIREKPASVNKQPVPVRVEFFFGDVLITSKDGRAIVAHQGAELAEESRVTTEASSQAEISVGAFSRIDLDNFADLSFDKIGSQEADRSIVEMFQKSGSCWYKITYEKSNEQYRVVAPSVTITVAGNGGNFLATISPDNVAVNLIDGQLLLERPDGGESINLVAGQTITIYNDGRPFQVAKLAPDLNAQEQFSGLIKEQKIAVSSGSFFNFLFIGPGGRSIVASMQFENNVLAVVNIPAQLSVGQFTDGIETLDEAYLYGGASFAGSILERILNVRIVKNMTVTRDNMLKVANMLGASGQAGDKKTDAPDLNKLLSAKTASSEEQEQRNRLIMQTLFDAFKSRSIILTAMTAQQTASLVESNFSANDLMDLYVKFTAGNWTLKDLKLPVEEERVAGKVQRKVQLEKCRALLGNSL